MKGFTRAALALGAAAALAACTDGNKTGQTKDRPEGVTAGPGTSGSTQGAGTAAGAGAGAGAAATPAPNDSAAAAGAAGSGAMAADTTRRDTTTRRP